MHGFFWTDFDAFGVDFGIDVGSEASVVEEWNSIPSANGSSYYTVLNSM